MPRLLIPSSMSSELLKQQLIVRSLSDEKIRRFNCKLKMPVTVMRDFIVAVNKTQTNLYNQHLSNISNGSTSCTNLSKTFLM
jgi:hypothetical protein